MKHAVTQELFAYWNDLRGERASPERGEVDPAVIRGVLADTFILEVDADQRYVFRLSGTRLNALFTHDLKGASFPALFGRADRLDVVDLLGSVCDEVLPVLAGITAAPSGREPIDLELLLLPVRHLGKTHARILGCLSPAALPSWIGLLPVGELALGGRRILGWEPGGRPLRGALVDSPAERLGSRAAARPHARRGHLFVHEGGLPARNPAS